MTSELVTGLIGLAGVVIGGLVTTYIPARLARIAAERADAAVARAAVRRALVGLESWADGIDYISQAPARHADKGDAYDIYLATEIRSLKDQLDESWWQYANELAEVATNEHWRPLKEAKKATGGMLTLMASVGDAGREAMHRSGEVARKRFDAEQQARAEARATAIDIQGNDPDDAEFRQKMAEADASIVQFAGETAEFFAKIAVRMDYRLDLARNVANAIASGRAKIAAAVDTCNELEAEFARKLAG